MKPGSQYILINVFKLQFVLRQKNGDASHPFVQFLRLMYDKRQLRGALAVNKRKLEGGNMQTSIHDSFFRLWTTPPTVS